DGAALLNLPGIERRDRGWRADAERALLNDEWDAAQIPAHGAENVVWRDENAVQRVALRAIAGSRRRGAQIDRHRRSRMADDADVVECRSGRLEHHPLAVADLGVLDQRLRIDRA